MLSFSLRNIPTLGMGKKIEGCPAHESNHRHQIRWLHPAICLSCASLARGESRRQSNGRGSQRLNHAPAQRGTCRFSSPFEGPAKCHLSRLPEDRFKYLVQGKRDPLVWSQLFVLIRLPYPSSVGNASTISRSATLASSLSQIASIDNPIQCEEHHTIKLPAGNPDPGS